MLHRHNRLAFTGSIHFITTVTEPRGNWFVTDEICREVLDVFEYYRKKFEIDCLGYVLMPDHLHALLYQTTDEPVVSKLMESFKRLTTKKLQAMGMVEGSLWRRRFDDVPVPGSDAAAIKLKYMLANPIRRGLVEHDFEYKWSSAPELYEKQENGIVTINRELLPVG